MASPIDMTRGGYRGDFIEEKFKPYTSSHMSYWWYFREVLRASPSRSDRWVKDDGQALTDDEQREFVGLSLLHYAAHMGFAEAIAGRDELNLLVRAHPADPFEFQRWWRAAYSGLYSSFTALFNLVLLLADSDRPLVKCGRVRNYYFNQVKDHLTSKETEPKPLLVALTNVNKRLEIRAHMGHYWLIWVQHRTDGVYMDSDFVAKGHLPIESPTNYGENVVGRLSKDIDETAADYDTVYKQLAVESGYLDRFLTARRFVVKYDDYKAPHNGARPRP